MSRCHYDETEVTIMPATKREITINEAIKYLPGMSTETLKKWLKDAYIMKARPCPFGDAVITEKGEWQYYIYKKRLEAYTTAQDIVNANAER